MSRRAPLVLFIDNVQWADQHLLAQLDHLLRTRTEAPILVLCTERRDSLDVSRSSTLGSLAGLESTTVLPIGQLTAPEVQMLRRSFEEASGQVVSEAACNRAYRAAGGRPYILLELFKALSEESEVHGTCCLLAHRSPPATLRHFLKPRIESLTAAAQNCLNVLAIIGGEVSTSLLVEILQIEWEVV
jgi:predicted ATPase